MNRESKSVEFNVCENSDHLHQRNVDKLDKDLSIEVEKLLMGSNIEKGDSVTVSIEVNKNGKEPST